ncbi:DUF6783 domain-containing protein [Fusicatenibacter saccharivorans]
MMASHTAKWRFQIAEMVFQACSGL